MSKYKYSYKFFEVALITFYKILWIYNCGGIAPSFMSSNRSTIKIFQTVQFNLKM